MTKNPYLNALMAALYIALVVLGINALSHLAGVQTKDNLLAPVSMLSLFVLSAAIMAYVFFYHPAILLLEGKRTEAVRMFLRTVAAFAFITLLAFIGAVALG